MHHCRLQFPIRCWTISFIVSLSLNNAGIFYLTWNYFPASLSSQSEGWSDCWISPYCLLNMTSYITHHWLGVTASAHPNLWLPGRNEVVIDRIIPWTLQVQDPHYNSCALTRIDFFTNLTELLISIESKGSLQVTACWFSHYPHPNCCVHDNGGEFVGYQFSSYWRIIVLRIFQPLRRIPNKPMQSVSWCIRLWRRYFN